MKHHIVIKFLAVFLCAASLLGAAAGGLGLFAVTELGLREQTLAEAYADSVYTTADALANAEIVEKIAAKMYRVHFGYLNMNGVMKVMKDMGLEQKNQKFDMECSLDTSVRLSMVDSFLERMGDVEGCNIEEI